MTHNRKDAKPTLVSRVEQALKTADDFMTLSMIAQATGLDRHHTEVCLWHLRKYRAIEALRVDDGLWWFLTPDTDTRARVVLERKPEDQPRRLARKRKIPLPALPPEGEAE